MVDFLSMNKSYLSFSGSSIFVARWHSFASFDVGIHFIFVQQNFSNPCLIIPLYKTYKKLSMCVQFPFLRVWFIFFQFVLIEKIVEGKLLTPYEKCFLSKLFSSRLIIPHSSHQQVLSLPFLLLSCFEKIALMKLSTIEKIIKKSKTKPKKTKNTSQSSVRYWSRET